MRAWVAGALACGMVACTAAMPVAGDMTSLTGQLRVTGSALHPLVLLQVDDDLAWELTGITAAQARALAGRQVTVRGTVLRAPAPHVWMPSIRVEEGAVRRNDAQ